MESKALDSLEFKPSWIGVVPDIILLFFLVGIVTLPVKVLKIINTKIVVDNGMIYGETGILKKDTQNSPLKHIQSVRVEKSLFGRIFGYGDIIITTSGDGYKYSTMAEPEKIRDAINSRI
ncbi:hypothetical protein DUF304 [Gottschalkia acidurici 9a]|uniref:YdbS-like PH domain-containing protein n=1 Tax=Gottschalkia acidurici (strain ATCC 7906 / DSM 604 / BCRC 14475 / CIP 104303 / KCTC 5404 / NCIMB 10678 / 9a) TaxID=1128398 RepID=K0B3L8_GOTA9|nr:PH domain-containing protein [Gottschalkia acidurici]AFS79206.1 hypothetical protein DUF304 [Gottschalkia acidurici 9a]